MSDQLDSELPDREIEPQERIRPRKKPGGKTAPPVEDEEILENAAVELPDYDETLYEQHRRVDFLKSLTGDIRFQITLGILLFGLLVWTVAPPIYQKLKLQKAMKLLAESELAIDEGNIPKSISLMRRAILMAPNEEQVFRKVRLFNAGFGDVTALNTIQGLMVEKQASSDELLTLAEQALKTDNIVIVKAALEQLEEDHSVRKIIIQMRLLDKEGNLKGALDLVREKLSTLPPEEAEKLLLATAGMTLKSDPPASRQILLQLMDKNSSTGISALRLIGTQALVQRDGSNLKTDKVADKLVAHPLHTPDDLLLALDLRILENPAAKPALLAQTATERANAHPDDALAFARWLNRRLYYKEAVDFIGRDRALSQSDWLLLYLDALAGQERWNDIFSMLDADTIIGLSDSIRLLFLARAAEKSGDMNRADESWREMQLGLAYEKPEVIAFIAAYALRIGEREQAIKAYTTLSQRKETALEGFLGLIRCWPSNTPAGELLPIYERFLEAFPMLSEARTDQTYLKLLTNDKPATNAAIAMEIYNSSPNSLATLSIAALGLLKTGDSSGADALYNDKNISWDSAPAPWKTVRAAVLQSVGKNAEASELARTIDKRQLRPEELALLPHE